MLKVELSCPFGMECERVVGDTIKRCRAYVTLAGRDPQTGEHIQDTRCSLLEWLPTLLMEGSRGIAGVQAATESFRNEMVRANNETGILLSTALSQRARVDRTSGECSALLDVHPSESPQEDSIGS